MTRLKSGGGWAAILYTLRMANRVGWWRLWQAMRSKNACKTCALGMGGQLGGMRNEAGHWPEVCKKSFQAMVADMQAGLRPEFFEQFGFAQMQGLTSKDLEWCGRLTAPLYAGPGDTHYRVIEWDDALARLAGHLRACSPQEVFFYASGRSSNEAGFLLQLFARVFGTSYINSCSYYCHQASGVALGRAFGTSTATLNLHDVEHTDLFFLIGGNPASNHPRLMRSLMTLRRRGGHVVVINPAKELGLVNFRVPSDLRSLLFGTEIASLYVQPHVGGDIALLTGVAKAVLERGAADLEYCRLFTEGFDTYQARVEATEWDAIEGNSGVDRATIEKIAALYAGAKKAVFGWTMGITHHEHGVANVGAIIDLALLRGMVGKEHTGLLPLRGHSNVQGIGSMGVVPNLKKDVLDRLEKLLNVPLPASPGLDTMACMHAADQGRMKAAICLGGNLYGANPDARFAGQALGQVGMVAYLNTTLNTGHVRGRGRETLVLPVLARDEECQRTTQESMFNYVRLSEGGTARHPGPRSEVDVLATLAAQVLPNVPVNWDGFREHAQLRQMIAQVIPGYEPAADIDQTRQEFYVKGRVVHDTTFRTPDGKARFTAPPIPPLRGGARQLRLMTVRSEGQFNSVVYENEDLYRGQERRDVILMNPADIERLGLHVDGRVTVRSATGVMRHILVRAFDVRAGNAMMYYPEANVLVPATVDPDSKTPSFKSVLVEVISEDLVEPVVAEFGVVAGRLPLGLVQP